PRRADRLRHERKKPRLVQAKHANPDMALDRALILDIPSHFDPTLLVVVERLRAGRRVYGHASAARDEADDAVARKRIATTPEANEHVVQVGHGDRVSGLASAFRD